MKTYPRVRPPERCQEEEAEDRRKLAAYDGLVAQVYGVSQLLRGYAPPTNEEAAGMLESIIAKAKGE